MPMLGDTSGGYISHDNIGGNLTSHVQDPIQFLADYLMKNNKKEDSDKEESEESKTDV